MNLRLLILLLLFTSQLTAQKHSLKGKVTDKTTGKGIAYVNVGLEKTGFGTSSNEKGVFKINLSNGKHTLIISCVGYKTETVNVIIPSDNYIDVSLQPIAIKMPQVVVNADENPAYRIIRKAIQNKEKNKKGLRNYYYNFYSKNKLKSGKDIVFIEEDIGEGYNQIDSEIKEIKHQIYHTENISKKTFGSSDLNLLEKPIIDFTKDSLTLGEFVFHLPISQFAFDYYDYELVGVKQGDRNNFFQIKVIPYSNIRPTFSGYILIDDSSYALTDVDLTLKSRNFLPFTNLKLSIIQNSISYKNYWLPKYYNIDVETNVNYYHLFKLDSAITSYVKVLNNFKINLDSNSTLIEKINELSDTSSHYEPQNVSIAKMDSIRLYPLDMSEIASYQKIDSSKSIVSSLQLGGVGGEYIKEMEGKDNKPDSGFSVYNLLNYFSFRNNRTDGIAIGLKFSNDNLASKMKYSTFLNYSFHRKDVNTGINLFFPLKFKFADAIEIFGSYESKFSNSLTPYSHLLNAFSVTFGFEDQFDYFFSRSIGFKFNKAFNKSSLLKFGITFENLNSLKAGKYFSIFNRDQLVRPNLITGNGIDNRFVFEMQFGKSPFDLDLVQSDGFISHVELSSKMLGSNFNYSRFQMAYEFYLETLYNELFFSPYLGVMITGSATLGEFKTMHLNTAETALGFYSPFGTFKGLTPYQFISEKNIALHLEHNWRKTFFDMLGIYFPVEWNIELTTGLSILKTWSRSQYIELAKSNDFYWETYAGISGILGFLSTNVAYNKYKNILVRLGFSKFL